MCRKLLCAIALLALGLAGAAAAQDGRAVGVEVWRIVEWSVISAVVAAGAAVVVVVIVHPGRRRHGHLPDGEAPPD